MLLLIGRMEYCNDVWPEGDFKLTRYLLNYPVFVLGDVLLSIILKWNIVGSVTQQNVDGPDALLQLVTPRDFYIVMF